METSEKTLEQQAQISTDEVYTVYDMMVKDTYASGDTYDMKRADAIIDQMLQRQ